ncbi:MAG: FtsX-like permease family protein [Chitinophagaceae bacterium]|nr:MAG: FtsX-like permease family protein [Chitinophagaceae bacterium]
MLKNYFRVAWRNITRNRMFSLINIAGLSIGMACTMFILLWVYQEKSWDKSQPNYNTVYHIRSNRNFNGEVSTGPDLMYPLGKAVQQAFPEIRAYATTNFGDNSLLTYKDKVLRRQTLQVSAGFFSVFPTSFLYGSAEALNDPSAIVLTESSAEAIFGRKDVLNESLLLNNNTSVQVKGVVKDVPQGSTIGYEAILPFNINSPETKQAESEWVNCGNRVFLDLNKNADVAALEIKILNLIRAKAGRENPTTRGSILLHPMSKWRLYEEFRDGKNAGGRIQYVNLFTWIAVVILVIACINFVNLSTARSEKRAKEVGIRKTMGSGRAALLLQFLAESVLLAFLAYLLAVLAVYLLLPSFGDLIGQQVRVPYSEPMLWIFSAAIVLIAGIVAGAYPAFFLSGFEPVKVLKGVMFKGKQSFNPRKALVTGQFIASIVLISATLIIYQQIQYVKKRDMGYNQENLVTVRSNKETDRNIEAIRNELLSKGIAQGVSRSSSAVTEVLGFTSGLKWTGRQENSEFIIAFMFADEGIASTIQARVTEGRDFAKGDSNTILLNREAVRLMGITNPVGSVVNWAGKERRIVGVIDNMVVTSPYEAPGPSMIVFESKWSGVMDIRLSKTSDMAASIATLEKTFRQYSPSFPFEFRFVNEEFNTKFNNEQMIGRLSVVFSGLAIFICCLGLFGLVAFSIERRNREIGIRKVLGASVKSILVLMSREFLLLVGLAFLVAVPIAWWMMSGWLQDYTYRVTIDMWVFVLVGLLILLIAGVTISLNASKAALKNPVKTLRSE